MERRIPAAGEPVPPAYLEALDHIDRLATRLDHQFRLPMTSVRFGWDPVMGLVPIAGDLVALAVSIRIIMKARELGASPRAQRRMAANAGIDALIGAIPIAGTVFDVFFKANLRNVDLLMDEIRKSRKSGR